MARGSSALPLVLLALAALFVAPAFVPSPAPRAAPEASTAALVAGAALPLLTAQPAMAEDYMMPPSWPFLVVFAGGAFLLLGAGNFIFPGEKK
ncbi:Fam135a [Symbiodinium pilosum]|uniref:Fam135a protein n=1 Tax=Symbiodinium pilosum TaxID=2952 RepID=A0A812M8W3_SYMPI|nr:Fam135a [Symbiodinium pilosum]